MDSILPSEEEITKAMKLLQSGDIVTIGRMDESGHLIQYLVEQIRDDDGRIAIRLWPQPMAGEEGV
jgi:hypothetical protein